MEQTNADEAYAGSHFENIPPSNHHQPLHLNRSQEALLSLLNKQSAAGGTGGTTTSSSSSLAPRTGGSRDHAHSRLRDSLRAEKQRSTEALKTCRDLEHKVVAMAEALREAERREQATEGLADELHAARGRSEALAQRLVESSAAAATAKEEAAAGAMVVHGSAPASPPPLVPFWATLWNLSVQVLIGFILLVTVAGFALLTLAAGLKVAHRLGLGSQAAGAYYGSDYGDYGNPAVRRTVY